MNNRISIAAIIILFSSIIVSAQTTITLQPDACGGKDALLHGLSSEVNNNYGANAQLAANAWTFSGSEGIVRSVIDFDLSSIPEGATVNNAKLHLYASDSNAGFGQHSTLSGSNACLLQRVTASWEENLVNWNSQPSITEENQVTLSESSSPTQDFEDIDVSGLVQDMVDDPSNSFGFLLRLQNESYYRLMNFASSDHSNSGLHPKLVITFTEPSSSTNVNDYFLSLKPNVCDGKDALLHGLSSEMNKNYGDNKQLAANAWTFSGSEGIVRSVIDFDLSSIPEGATVNNAKLHLYASDSNAGFGQHSTLSGSNACLLQRVTASWEENLVNWSSQPSTTEENQVALSESSSPTQDYQDIDVSGLVQDMVDDPSNSYGFLLKLQNESYYRLMNFASSDHPNAALHPKLEISYSIFSNTTPSTFLKVPNTFDVDIISFKVIPFGGAEFEITPVESTADYFIIDDSNFTFDKFHIRFESADEVFYKTVVKNYNP